MYVFQTSLELGVHGDKLALRMSFGSYQEINRKEVPVSESAGLRTRNVNPLRVLDE